LQRLCRRSEATGVKLLGGDLECSGDSVTDKVGVVNDSGMIPGQHKFSVK